MTLPQVSVLIPTYNHARFLPQTLESVFAQDGVAMEVIVVNDGSVDDTVDLLTPFVETGSIRYAEQPSAGASAAHNRALAMSTGKYVALLDDDDLFPADKLA